MKCSGLRKIRKRTIIIAVVLLVAVLLIAAAAVWYLRSAGGGQQSFSFGNRQGGMQLTMAGDMVAASGVISVGVTEESFEVENLTTALEIEEVYVRSEETVTRGTKILKLSEKSVEEARKELEQVLKEADLAYRAGAIAYEQSKITAEYELESALLGGEQAQAVYEETLAGLNDSVERAQEEWNQAKEDIAEYQSYVNSDSYRSYFKVDEYQAAYDETLAMLKEKMDEWGVSWSQVTGQGGTMSMGNTAAQGRMAESGFDGTVSGGDGLQSSGPSADQIQVLASLYGVLEKQRRTLDQALDEYENALANASFELQTLELQLPQLENALAEAEKSYQKQVLQAEITYETSLTNARNAQSDYDTAMEQAETTYQSLKKEWEDAQENLELFESSVGDGCYYASGSGTILRTMVRAGQKLNSEATIFMYSNPEKMTVTVSVDQANISEVALDSAVYIQSETYGGFEGIVTEINPVSDSDSRTSVTYRVTVQLQGDTTALPANESVTVIFGMEAAGRPEGGQMPEGGRKGNQ